MVRKTNYAKGEPVMEPIIKVEGLAKEFGEIKAVKGIFEQSGGTGPGSPLR